MMLCCEMAIDLKATHNVNDVCAVFHDKIYNLFDLFVPLKTNSKSSYLKLFTQQIISNTVFTINIGIDTSTLAVRPRF